MPSIEKLTALEPGTIVGVRAGDLLACLAAAADRLEAVQEEVALVIAHAKWVTEDLTHRRLFPTGDVIQPLSAALHTAGFAG